MIKCENCEGAGLVEVQRIPHPTDVDERYKLVACEECDGSGEIEVEDEEVQDDEG